MFFLMKRRVIVEWIAAGFRYAFLAVVLGSVSSVLLLAQNPSPLEKEAQKPVEGSQPASSNSVSTGAPRGAVLDAQHRPITAGGFVSSGPVIFKDVAAAAGLMKWKHVVGTPEKNFIIETLGS